MRLGSSKQSRWLNFKEVAGNRQHPCTAVRASQFRSLGMRTITSTHSLQTNASVDLARGIQVNCSRMKRSERAFPQVTKRNETKCECLHFPHSSKVLFNTVWDALHIDSGTHIIHDRLTGRSASIRQNLPVHAGRPIVPIQLDLPNWCPNAYHAALGNIAKGLLRI